VPYARSPHTGRVHYAERGEARPGSHLPVLLIHGAGASSAIWMMVLARLGRILRAVAIDLPGHGPSPAAEGNEPASITSYRDAVGGLAATLCLGRSVLVGHSMGALVALEAALTWPDKVAALVLCGARPRLPVHDDLLAIVRDNYQQFPVLLAERALSPAAKPALRRAFVGAGLTAPRETALADYAAIAAADFTGRLPALTCPVIWLHGADDRIVPPPPEQTAGPNSAVIVLPDVGHILPVEAPAAIADVAVRLAAISSG
jgi:pimeloyl-ACP methyl ester carboxylesterase